MKLMMMFIMAGFIFSSCGGANDGNAATDTTTVPLDTNRNANTSNHINRADGTKVADSTGTDTLHSPY
jgi:hypothetical protein